MRLDTPDHINDMTILLPRRKSHASPNHLNNKISGSCGPGEENAVNVRYISSFGEDSAVDENGVLSIAELLDQLVAVGSCCQFGV